LASAYNWLDLCDFIKARTPAACGQAIEVPDMVAKAVSDVIPADLTFAPGAPTCGLISVCLTGPLEENEAKVSPSAVAATEMTPETESAGDPMVEHPDPEFPAAKTGQMLTACHVLMAALKAVFPPPDPHEFETRCGAWSQSDPPAVPE